MDTIKHELNGYRIPAYMEEILTQNYCPYFVRMSMIRDGDSYRFSYRPGRMTRLRLDSLDIYDKLVLIRSLITINEAAESYLISAENYLIEPELIYTADGSTVYRKLKILFYPDVKRMRFDRKLMLFCERIRSDGARDERELFDQLRELLGGGSINKTKIFLDKSILRIENRMLEKTG